MEEIATLLLVLIIGFLFCCAGGLILGVVLSPLFLVLWLIKRKKNKLTYHVSFNRAGKVHAMQNLDYNQFMMVRKSIIKKGYRITEVRN